MTIIYVLIWRCRLEAQDNVVFSSLFTKSVCATEDAVRSLLSHTVIECRGLDWDRYKSLCRDAVCCWDSYCKTLISDEPTALLRARIAKEMGKDAEKLLGGIEMFGGANGSGTEGRTAGHVRLGE